MSFKFLKYIIALPLLAAAIGAVVYFAILSTDPLPGFDPAWDHYRDQVQHSGAFFIIAALTLVVVPKLIPVCVTLGAAALALEGLHLVVPGRQATLSDAAWSWAGIAAAATVFLLTRHAQRLVSVWFNTNNSQS